MITSEKGIDLIALHEGLRLEAYQDVKGVWTVGYGHTGDDVYAGLVIDGGEAERLLRSDLNAAETCVDEQVDVQITQEQFDALVSLVFNIGCNAFRNSTLLKMLNLNNMEAAKAQFSKWNKSGGKVIQGLVNRRRDEAELFLA